MTYDKSSYSSELEKIWVENEDAIRKEQPYPAKERRQELLDILNIEGMWVTLGGPLQNHTYGNYRILLFI